MRPYLAISMACLLLSAASVAMAQEKSADDLFREANEAFVEGRYEASVGLYQKTLEKESDRKEAWYNLGVAHGQLRQYDKEIESYRKALELDPVYPRAHYNLALALEDQGKSEEALQEYALALQGEPEALDALINQGILLSRLGKLDEALDSYGRAVDVDPGVAEVYYNIGVVYSKKAQQATDEAEKTQWLRKEVESYEKALEKRSTFYRACYNLALAYYRLGDTDKEIEAYERAITLRRSYPEVLFNLAYAYEEKGNLPKALETWRRYVEVASKVASEKDFQEVAEKEIKRLEELTRESSETP